jgi:hypothetical protein
MIVKFDFSALKKTKWYEYGLRFLFGGLITVLTGLVAKKFGPSFGGLFLAFPAIFPASATLVEKHEREKKLRAGILHTTRGRDAAALDSMGAALGTFGLACFALTASKLLLGSWAAAVTLIAATSVWLGVSISIWRLHREH